MNVYFCEHSSTFIFNWILFILACNKNSYKSLDGFEIRQDKNKMLDLIWIQTVWHSDGIPERIFQEG